MLVLYATRIRLTNTHDRIFVKILDNIIPLQVLVSARLPLFFQIAFMILSARYAGTDLFSQISS